MKGYRMILLVNGALLLFIAAFAWALTLGGCDENIGAPGDCDPNADPVHNIALVLIPIGLVLLGLGILLGRRPDPPETTP